jgi:hypothetical protein
MVTFNVKPDGAYAVNKSIRQTIKDTFGTLESTRTYSESGYVRGQSKPNKTWRYKWYEISPKDLTKAIEIKQYVDTIAPVLEAQGVQVRCELAPSQSLPYRRMMSMRLITKKVESKQIRKPKK